jgi:hypothetical protein
VHDMSSCLAPAVRCNQVQTMDCETGASAGLCLMQPLYGVLWMRTRLQVLPHVGQHLVHHSSSRHAAHSKHWQLLACMVKAWCSCMPQQRDHLC